MSEIKTSNERKYLDFSEQGKLNDQFAALMPDGKTVRIYQGIAPFPSNVVYVNVKDVQDIIDYLRSMGIKLI